MILGGMIGLTIGVLTGMAQGTAWPTILLRSSGAALLAGLVFRWWGGVWIKGLRQASQERTATGAKAASQGVKA